MRRLSHKSMQTAGPGGLAVRRAVPVLWNRRTVRQSSSWKCMVTSACVAWRIWLQLRPTGLVTQTASSCWKRRPVLQSESLIAAVWHVRADRPEPPHRPRPHLRARPKFHPSPRPRPADQTQAQTQPQSRAERMPAGQTLLISRHRRPPRSSTNAFACSILATG